MKQRDEILFVEDILIFCGHIEKYTEGVSKTDFLNYEMLQDALVRKIEIIGEAVKNISKETRSKFPEIDWSDIAKMRDKDYSPLFSGGFGRCLENCNRRYSQT